jgi:hypothetical protein
MRNLYDILTDIEKRPAMFLGNGFDLKSLDNFILGFMYGGGKLSNPKSHYPDFSLFTNWLGGMLKINSEKSAANWSWLLKEKFKDDKKTFMNFFYYLNIFKSAEPIAYIIPIKTANIDYAINNNSSYLWCVTGNGNVNYKKNLRKINSIVIFNLNPSRTTFTLLLDKNSKVIEDRNYDMTGKILLKEIEKQFNISLSKIKPLSAIDSIETLRKYKII